MTVVQKLVASLTAQRLRRAAEIHAQFEQSRRRTTQPLPLHLRFA
jgi:hypothetical protein